MKKLLTRILLFVLFAAALGGALLCLLPAVADRYLLPRIAAGLPFSEKQLSIVKVTPWGLQGVILLEDQQESGIAVPRFTLRYSPSEILRGRIDTLLIDSASLSLEEKGGTIGVRGMQTRQPAGQADKEDVQLPAVPVNVERIEMKRCRIAYVAEDGGSHYFGVEGTFTPGYEDAEGGSRLASLSGTFAVKGGVEAQGVFATEPAADGHRMTFTLTVENIGAVGQFFDIPEDAGLSGSLDLKGEIETTGITALSAYSVSASLSAYNFGFGGVRAAAAEKPLTLEIQGTPARLHYLVENVEISQPESVKIDLEGSYELKTNRVEGTADLLSGRTGTAIAFTYGGQMGAVVDLDYTLKSEGVTLDSAIEVAAFSADGSLRLSPEAVSVNIQARIPDIKDTSRQLELAGITLELVFNTPEIARGVVIPGNLIIDQIRYKNIHAGTLKGAVSIADDRLMFSSQMTSPLLEDVLVTCSGESDYRLNAEIHCSQPPMVVTSAALAGLVSLPEKLDFETRLAAESRLYLKDGVASGTAQCSYENGRITYDSFVLSGISGKILLPSLPDLRSAPSQPLNIGTLQLGSLSMADARIRLRLDDASTLFIEEAKVNWCGGRVEAAALRLQKGMDSLETTLYCDRLGYTQLLDQLGIGEAQGEGSLNGRLPIRISGGSVAFDQGFLFSTPGKSGIVNFSNTEQFRRGIAAAEESIYLEYSLEALRNFSYDWTRLTFDSQGDELLISLELDGKPAKPLPFGYAKGRIVKQAEGGGIQHPIRLDVNFRLPVEELFRYGKGIQSLMESM